MIPGNSPNSKIMCYMHACDIMPAWARISKLIYLLAYFI